jgi:hypothetical protein
LQNEIRKRGWRIAINPDRFDKLITTLRAAVDMTVYCIKKQDHGTTYLMLRRALENYLKGLDKKDDLWRAVGFGGMAGLEKQIRYILKNVVEIMLVKNEGLTPRPCLDPARINNSICHIALIYHSNCCPNNNCYD